MSKKAFGWRPALAKVALMLLLQAGGAPVHEALRHARGAVLHGPSADEERWIGCVATSLPHHPDQRPDHSTLGAALRGKMERDAVSL